ncbi:reverse transcriptase [Gossypium australe]|uniref:Reverse transcriptase n=1 Tax=Gossypium australe TaxID=47621 RepID=A0A5B6WNZ3_9ROSI|nr:reverse transcriptase [Gossypium australe]
MDDLALVDIKPDSGWFTWVNNRSGGSLIKERIDRFLSSVSLVENFPFIATKVVRQTQLDHDAIVLDLWGHKPKEYPNDHRLCFKFDLCSAGDREAKNIIGSAWNRGDTKYGDKLQRVRSVLGPWQHKKYGKIKSDMQILEKNINLIIDSTSRGDNVKTLKETRDCGNKNISNLNETMIILIPKIRDPCELSNFCPISLCRFIYKIISKVYTNCLKVVLSSCISQNQSAFMSGRMIHNNILIAHELLHYLGSSKNKPNKGFAVKLDMSKAYDRVEWDFVETIMMKMAFDEKWIEKL